MINPADPAAKQAGPARNRIGTSLQALAVTIPAGTGPDRLPRRIQIIRRRSDGIAWARPVEAAIA